MISIARVIHVPLCNSNFMMFAIWLTVPCIILIFCRYVTDILKMCMMKLNDEKIIFDKFKNIFNLDNFRPLQILNNGYYYPTSIYGVIVYILLCHESLNY